MISALIITRHIQHATPLLQIVIRRALTLTNSEMNVSRPICSRQVSDKCYRATRAATHSSHTYFMHISHIFDFSSHFDGAHWLRPRARLSIRRPAHRRLSCRRRQSRTRRAAAHAAAPPAAPASVSCCLVPSSDNRSLVRRNRSTFLAARPFCRDGFTSIQSCRSPPQQTGGPGAQCYGTDFRQRLTSTKSVFSEIKNMRAFIYA